MGSGTRNEGIAGLAIGLFLLLVQATFAEDGGPVLVGVENFAHEPIYFVDADGRYDGLLRDLVDAFARHEGFQPSYRIFAVPELFAAFFAAEVDLKIPDNPRWRVTQRQGLEVHYSRSLLRMTDGVMVLAQHRGRSPSRLKRLGVIRGFTPVPYVNAIAAGQIEALEVDDFDSLFRLLLEQRVDGVYASVAMAEHYLKNLDTDTRDELPQVGASITFDASLPHTGSDYHLSSLTRPEIIRRFDAFMQSNREEILAIFARWGLSESMFPGARSSSDTEMAR